MCGLTGFFTGCQFARDCDKAHTACPHRMGPRLFANWHEKASVRRSPRRVIDPEDVHLDLFPRDLVPVASHEIVTSRYPEKIPHLLALWLYRYLTFTVNLETLVVNTTTSRLVSNKAPVALSGDEILFAYKVYCDEAYHALFCADMLQQVYSQSDFRPAPQGRPSFLLEYEKIDGDPVETAIRQFIFTAVSEMLITVSLNNVREGLKENTPLAIRQIMTDHAQDESRHHAFYRDILKTFLGQLAKDEAVRLAASMPNYLMAFVAPDIPNIVAELEFVGLSPDEARQVCAETYRDQTVTDYARACSTGLAGLLEETGLLEREDVAERFATAGITG
ncbi:acyl-ACP desaturase [Stappia indica]|uniref:acyl-ACP desaturase n=1 Tax=Stappia indica TaxID=538381 RepID=UPI001CD30000|nr:acyl-ACP desaturase [Stappia indica]MCA1298589.1 diiron oxygenase [Stappia indica]